MQRTSLMLPEEVLQRLRNIAADRGASLATVIREALEDKARTYRPRPRSLGIGASGSRDTAQKTSDERAVPRSWR